ncbi:MAG: nucleotidyl transferase AbiEii/AbiGii toxin family protein [Bacteroidetes bacterium]|nr:nucleotidyl transferase AbiEii/AbiGii toxin family protein [Bacteroidota bacterium]
MILPESRTIEWLQRIATENNFPNITMLEKTIRAFSLLESLALSGCPFVFKGGTALMLHLDSAKRLSIDIDIICPPETDIVKYLSKNAELYGFNEIKLVERKTTRNIPKSHAKFYYQVTYNTNTETDCILLDVLFEEIHYNNVVQLPIESRLLKTDGEKVFVNVPSVADLLGDKLTAFAPNTTGIPYYKGNKMCSMEIVKQLYDIASLFDVTNDLSVTTETFRKFAVVELAYRNLNLNNIQQVLNDIFQTSLCVCLQGQIDNENFKLLQDGIKRIQSFIHSERYMLDTAIINASKVAYLSTLIANNLTKVEHFDKNNISELQNAIIENLLPTKLNKLKMSNIEAFFYWWKVFEIVTHNIVVSK